MTAPRLLEGQIALKIKAPFLFPGVDAGAFGYDRVAMRDLDGNLIVPMDQVRGLLRHGLVDIGRFDIVDALFGRESGANAVTPADSYLPDRSALFLSDLVAEQIPMDKVATAPMHRVKIEPESGAAAEGHLLTLEQVAAAGHPVTFTGWIAAITELEEDVLVTALDTALSVHGSVGSLKSVGFGEVTDVKVTLAGQRPGAPLPDPGCDLVDFTFQLDRPYLIDPERVAANALLGRPDIPGGAIKGLLAQNLKLRGAAFDAQAFSQFRIGHASRKSDPKALRYDERVHTRINPDTGAAFDEMLFTTIAVANDPEGFSCQLDLAGIEPVQRRVILGMLGRPLFGLGMTGATMTPASFTKAQPTSVSAGLIALVLRAPALLAEPADDASSCFSANTAFWKKVLPDSALTDCTVRHRLVGGYHALRFRVTSDSYRPWVLTESGSTFVFDLHEEDVDAMTSILRRGLCRAELAGQPLTWENCPFVAENGYGSFELLDPQALATETCS